MRAKNKKIYKKALPIGVVALGIAVLGLGAAAIIPQFKTWTSALRGENTFISIQSPNEIKLEISPQDRAAGKLITASDYASIKTDSSSGYTLSYSVQGEAKTNELVNKDDDTARIASLSDVAETATFPVNHWGVSTDGEYWAPLPAYGQSEEVKTTTEPTKEDRFDFSIGVKVDSSTPSGEYTNTLCLTAVTNPVAEQKYSITYDADGGAGMPENWAETRPEGGYLKRLPELNQIPSKNGFTFGGWTTVRGNQAAAYSPGSDIWLLDDREQGLSANVTLYPVWVPNDQIGFGSLTGDNAKMQNMAPDVCKNVAEGTTGRLQDSRDYKFYYVTKEADGKCWMTQNLALQIMAGHEYTLKDTNIDDEKGWTPTVSTLPVGLESEGTEEDYIPVSYNPGDEYYPSSGNDSKDLRQPVGNAHYASGNLYNWTAAIASNDSSQYNQPLDSVKTSICPRGWRLPHMSQGSGASEFRELLTQHDKKFPKQRVLSDSSLQHYYKQQIGSEFINVGFQHVRQEPLWFVRAGVIPYSFYDPDGQDNRGLIGMYQGDTISVGSAPSNIYQLHFGSADIYNADYAFERSHGISVRCIAQ